MLREMANLRERVEQDRVGARIKHQEHVNLRALNKRLHDFSSWTLEAWWQRGWFRELHIKNGLLESEIQRNKHFLPNITVQFSIRVDQLQKDTLI